jgi:hypothetical protein
MLTVARIKKDADDVCVPGDHHFTTFAPVLAMWA